MKARDGRSEMTDKVDAYLEFFKKKKIDQENIFKRSEIKKEKEKAERAGNTNPWHIIERASDFVLVVPRTKQPRSSNQKKFDASVAISFDFVDATP